jgi:hypothetical protein
MSAELSFLLRMRALFALRYDSNVCLLIPLFLQINTPNHGVLVLMFSTVLFTVPVPIRKARIRMKFNHFICPSPYGYLMK